MEKKQKQQLGQGHTVPAVDGRSVVSVAQTFHACRLARGACLTRAASRLLVLHVCTLVTARTLVLTRITAGLCVCSKEAF